MSENVFDELGLTPVQTKKVSESIYEQIRDKILSGELAPGERLPTEKELIELFQRSRPSVREALRMLESKKYITITRSRGAVVNKISADRLQGVLDNMLQMKLATMADVLKVRRVCENMAIKLAAQNRDDHDLEVMENILKKAHEVMADEEQYVDCGMEFNVAMARSSKNQILYIISRMVAVAGRDNYITGVKKLSETEVQKNAERTYREHLGLLEAIRIKDSELACERNLKHIQGTRDTFH